MFVVAVAWLYVVLMMAVAEATGNQGSVLGAVFTFVGYGVLPLAIVLYLMNASARRRARRSAQPGGGDHAAGDAVAPERKEP